MSLNKIIIIFVLLLFLFGGFIFYQFGNKTTSKMKTSGKVTIGNQVFETEVVRSDKDKQIGLTKYSFIAPNQSMLFIFDQPGFYAFWMKGMKFPLDMIFIQGETIVSFAENVAPPANNTEPKTYAPESSADKVLEINAGLVKKYNIKKGDKVKIQI